jgi:hypothetical protein
LCGENDADLQDHRHGWLAAVCMMGCSIPFHLTRVDKEEAPSRNGPASLQARVSSTAMGRVAKTSSSS